MGTAEDSHGARLGSRVPSLGTCGALEWGCGALVREVWLVELRGGRGVWKAYSPWGHEESGRLGLGRQQAQGLDGQGAQGT